MHSLSAVLRAVFLTVSPISFTASMLMPVFVEPTLTLAQMLSVTARASGMLSISNLSLSVIPFDTTAE